MSKELSLVVRSLWKSRGFTLAAVALMALCVGANTAVFSVVYGVLWKPLNFPEPDRLVSLSEKIGQTSGVWGFSTPDYLFFQQQEKSFSTIAAYTTLDWELSGVDRVSRVTGLRVTPSLFQVLRTKPLLGRAFTAQDDSLARRVALLSGSYWRKNFGARPDVVGRTIYLDRQAYTVVGVMPETFVFPLRHTGFNGKPADVYVPMSFTPFERTGYGYMFNKSVIARLQTEVNPAQANAEANVILKRASKRYPSEIKLAAELLLYKDAITGRLRRGLMILLSAIALVLLIGCANVANLLLARCVTRRHEFAIRSALGAAKSVIVRQSLLESVILSLASGALGCILALWLTPIFVRLTPVEMPRIDEISVDFAALVFTLSVCCLCPLIFGLAPAFEMAHLDIASTLRQAGRSATQSDRQRRWMTVAVVSEYALTVILLVGAGLLMRSFLRLRQVDPGFQTAHILSMAVKLPQSNYKTGPDILSFYDQVIRKTESLPGVQSVGAISDLPLQTTDEWGLAIEGKAPESGVPRSVLLSWVSGDAMKGLGLKLKRGRFIGKSDVASSPKSVVINEAMVRNAWPNQDPIGQHLGLGGKPDSTSGWQTVVGVISDVRQGLSNVETKPQVFESLAQANAMMMANGANDFGIRAMRLIIKSAQEPLLLTSSVRQIIANLDPALPVTDVTTLDQYVSDSINPQRFDTYLIGLFACLALLLAVVGIGGVLSYTVARRTNEMGLRMALGGARSDIVQLIVREGLALAGLGIAIGIAIALPAAQVLSKLLYETSASDMMTFALIPALLIATTLVASLIPAWRATRVDPMIALRSE